VRLDDLHRKLSDYTRLVAFSHVSNVVGYINPAAEICTRARRAGARVLIDAAQVRAHVPLDMQAFGCDFLTFSSHKMIGPMGVGVLWARLPKFSKTCRRINPAPIWRMTSTLTPGRFEHAARKIRRGHAQRFRADRSRGSRGLHERARSRRHRPARAIDHCICTNTIARRVRSAAARTARTFRAATGFSFTLEGHTPQEILLALDAKSIAIRAGDLGALPLLKRLGATAAARASWYLYTREQDVDQLIQSLQSLQRQSSA